jgi:autotransporter-associated beta strand protein
VKLGIDNALPTGTNVTFGITSGAGGNLDLNGFNQEVASLASLASASGGIRNNASGTTSTLTVSGSGSGSFGLVIADNTSGTGTVALVRSGTGTLTLTGQNTYTGGTTVSSGTLALGHATNTLADTGAVTVSGGTLSLGSNSDTVGAVTLASGSITGSGTLTGSSYDVRSGTISANLGGTAALTKTTAGSVTMSGSNSYSGGTVINAGTLVVAGSGSATGSAAVIVNSGGTLAGDNPTGALAGTVTIASGGTLAPGTGGTTTGILKVSNDVTFQSGSTFEAQIKGTTPGTQHDQLAVSSGNVSLSGALNVDLNTFSPGANEMNFVLINNTSTSGTLSGTFSNYADGDTVSNYGGRTWMIFYGSSADAYGGTNGNDVVIAATPEPSSILAMCAIAAGVFYLARHLRRRGPLGAAS